MIAGLSEVVGGEEEKIVLTCSYALVQNSSASLSESCEVFLAVMLSVFREVCAFMCCGTFLCGICVGEGLLFEGVCVHFFATAHCSL